MSLEAIPVELGEWLPDLPPLENPGALEARNCIPQAKSYRSFNSLESFTNALTSACLGSLWFQASDSTIVNFAGDSGALYELITDNTWSDVSQAGGYANITNWDMIKFGERAIAVGLGTNPQSFDVGTSTLFADLGGSPPIAAKAGVIRDFVVLGNLQDFGPNFIAWSGFNSSILWTPSRATQSDRQELFGKGGRVQAVVPGEYGVIVQEHSIYRMDYTGPPTIFQLDEVERGRGTPAANSVCWTGHLVFYYGHDGFYVFDGQSSTPLGADRVNTWFKQNSDDTSLDSMYGVVDRNNRLVLWGFKSTTAAAQNDRIIVYNWANNRWAYAEIDTQILAEFVSAGFTLDQLDTPLPLGIDLDSIGVDSTQFRGGALDIQAFDSLNRSSTFSGTALTAIIDTAEYRGANGRRLYTNSQRPIVDGDANTVVKVAVGKRNLQNETVDFSPLRRTNRIGESNNRLDARYHRYRLSIAGGFEHAQGIEINQRQSGKR